MYRKLSKAERDKKIFNTFKRFKKGPSVPRDGNCGLYAICRALHDVLDDITPATIMSEIFCMFGLRNLPNYWWSDDELAVVANYYGCETVIIDEKRNIGTVFGTGTLSAPVVLYSVNSNSHWTPGTRTKIPSTNVPESYAIINNITEVLSIPQIKVNINLHLQRQYMNPSEALIENYSSSSGRRFESRIRRHNGGHRETREKVQDGSHDGRKNKSINKIRDKSYSEPTYNVGRYDGGGRIIRDESSIRQLEADNGGEAKLSSIGGKKGSQSEINYEGILVQCSPTVNSDISLGEDVAKQKLSLCAKLKNTVLSKTVKLCRLKRYKENKYKHFDLPDSKDDEDGNFENWNDAKLDDIGVRYTTKRDMLPKADVGCGSSGTVDCCSSVAVDCSPTYSANRQFRSFESPLVRSIEYPLLEPIADCSNLQMSTCPYMTTSSCTFTSSVCPCMTCNCTYTCNIDDCPFNAPEYACGDQSCLSDNNYICDLLNDNAARRNKNKVVRLINRICNRTAGITKSVMPRCFVKRKPAVAVSVVAVPIMVASVVAAPAVAASMDNDPVQVKSNASNRRNFSFK